MPRGRTRCMPPCPETELRRPRKPPQLAGSVFRARADAAAVARHAGHGAHLLSEAQPTAGCRSRRWRGGSLLQRLESCAAARSRRASTSTTASAMSWPTLGRTSCASNGALTGLRSERTSIFGPGYVGASPETKFGDSPVGNSERLCEDRRVLPTVLIVDDHGAFRASARRLLEAEGFPVVGEAADGESGLSLARRLTPDLVLLDVALPDMSGYDVAERLAGSTTRVVLVSSRSQQDLGRRVRGIGVLGFIAKDHLTAEALLDLVPAK
jgi:CheY-like chemotaxis protein